MKTIYEHVEERKLSNVNQENKIIVFIDPDIEDLIPYFFETRQKEIETIPLALEQKDFRTIRHIGHILKGEGGSYGFDYITSIGNFLEEAAIEANSKKIDNLLNELKNYLERVEIVYQ